MERLPNELLLLVLLELPIPSIGVAVCVSKLWNRIVNGGGEVDQKVQPLKQPHQLLFWKKKSEECRLIEGTLQKDNNGVDWKQLFVDNYMWGWQTQHPDSEVTISQNKKFVHIHPKSTQRAVLANRVFTSGKHSWYVTPHELSNASWIGIAEPDNVDLRMHLNAKYALAAGANHPREPLFCTLDMETKKFTIVNTKGLELLNETYIYEKASPAVSNNIQPGFFTISATKPRPPDIVESKNIPIFMTTT